MVPQPCEYAIPHSIEITPLTGLNFLGLFLRELMTLGCLPKQHNFALLEVASRVLINEYEGQVVSCAELLVDFTECRGKVEAAQEEADGDGFAA